MINRVKRTGSTLRVVAWVLVAASLVTGLFAVVAEPASAQGDFVVTTDDYTVNQLIDTVTVEFEVIPGATAVGAYQIEVTYDPTLVTPVTAAGLPACVPITGAAISVAACNETSPGVILISAATVGSWASDTKTISLDFTTDGVEGTTPLGITVNTGVGADNQDLTGTGVAGSITIALPTVTPTSTSTPTATATPTASPTATTTPSPTATTTPSPTATTDPTATPIPTATSIGPVQAPQVSYQGPFSDPGDAEPGDGSGLDSSFAGGGLGASSFGPSGTAAIDTTAAADADNTTVGGIGGGDSSQDIASGEQIAVTGAETPIFATVSIALMVIGGVMMVVSRRDDDETI